MIESIDNRFREITYIDGFEIVPKWKQCGEYDTNWSDDEKWLWNSGSFDYHMELVSLNDPDIDKKYFERVWYVWKDDRVWGYIILVNGKGYITQVRDGGMCWESPKHSSIYGAIYYTIMCYYSLKAEKYEVKEGTGN